MVSLGQQGLRRGVMALGLASLVWPLMVAGQSVMTLPPPGGAQQVVLRLANPAAEGYWLVRWMQMDTRAPGEEQVWQQQLRTQHGLQMLGPTLGLIPAGSRETPVVMQEQGGAWLLSQWQSTPYAAPAWRALRTVEPEVPDAQLVSDWLIEAGLRVSRQQIWRFVRQDWSDWRTEVGKAWQREGWRLLQPSHFSAESHLQSWRRGRLERLALWLPQRDGASLLLTQQAMPGGQRP